MDDTATPRRVAGGERSLVIVTHIKDARWRVSSDLARTRTFRAARVISARGVQVRSRTCLDVGFR